MLLTEKYLSHKISVAHDGKSLLFLHSFLINFFKYLTIFSSSSSVRDFFSIIDNKIVGMLERCDLGFLKFLCTQKMLQWYMLQL